jgi:DNA integrity scanning protein DisA with diadenylate cyclase activity
MRTATMREDRTVSTGKHRPRRDFASDLEGLEQLRLLDAAPAGQITCGARVVVVYPGSEAEALDSLTAIGLGEHLERLIARDLRALESWVPFETRNAVVDTAVEIGREGREGKSVGSLIVVGDVRHVLPRTRPLGFDPFKGYRRKERNVRDPRVREAIKEIALLDGAFVVARDGTVEASCRLIDAPMTGLTLPKGLGTRHWTAAAITAVTRALAVVVSQSSGTVRLFQKGEVILRIAPMRHARAMSLGRFERKDRGGGAPLTAVTEGDASEREMTRHFVSRISPDGSGTARRTLCNCEAR